MGRLIHGHAAQQAEIIQHLACAQHPDSSGSSAIRTGKPVSVLILALRFFRQRAAAAQQHAVIGNVCAEFGRCVFQRRANTVHDRRHAGRERVANLRIHDGRCPGNAADQVAAPHFLRISFASGNAEPI